MESNSIESAMRVYLNNMVAANGGMIRAAGAEDGDELTGKTVRHRVERFDDVQMETIKGMYRSNVPLRAIAQHFSCTEGTIERLVLRLVRGGIIERRRPIPQGRRVEDADDSAIAELYNAGSPLRDIADRFGKSINAIQIILRRLKRTGAVVARGTGRPRRHVEEKMRAAA